MPKTSTRKQAESQVWSGDIAAKASQAQTAAEHLALVTDIEEQLRCASEAHAVLESQRGYVLLRGGDVDEFHEELGTAADRVKTLSMAHSEALKTYQEAAEREKAEALERAAQSTREQHLEGWKADLRQFHEAMLGLKVIADSLNEHRLNIDLFNSRAEGVKRPDLVIRTDAARADISQELGASSRKPKKSKRHDGESEAAFELRQGNEQAKVLRASELTDPLRVLGDQVMAGIEGIVFEMDAHQRSRNRRLVNRTSFVSHDGRAVEKIADVPGSALAVEGKIKAGPYIQPGSKSRHW